MVPTQALQKNFYFCATAGQIQTHSSDQGTWPVWGFVLLLLNQNAVIKPQQTTCTHRRMTYSATIMSAKFSHTFTAP